MSRPRMLWQAYRTWRWRRRWHGGGVSASGDQTAAHGGGQRVCITSRSARVFLHCAGICSIARAPGASRQAWRQRRAAYQRLRAITIRHQQPYGALTAPWQRRRGAHQRDAAGRRRDVVWASATSAAQRFHAAPLRHLSRGGRVHRVSGVSGCGVDVRQVRMRWIVAA